MPIRTAALRALALAGAAAAALAACAEPPPPGPITLPPGVFNADDFAWSVRPGDAAIAGRIDYRVDGQAFSCIGSVGLTPDTPYTRNRFRTLYGSIDQAAVPVSVVRARDVPDPNSDYRSFVRSTTCANNRFDFTGLPDGSWFIIAPVRAGQGEPIALMRRVQTRAGLVVNITL